MEVAGAAALVTGGTSGLGLAVGRLLHAAGARVVLTGRDPDRAAKAAAEFGGAVTVVTGDAADPADMERAVAAATGLGPLRVLVTCAGTAGAGRVLGRRGPLPLESFAGTVRTNLIGTFNAVRLAAAAMAGTEEVNGERGVIVCTSSIAGVDGRSGQAAYAASKAAVDGMTLPLARDLARHLIRVVTLAPGLYVTPALEALPAAALTELRALVPHPARFGRAEEYAALVSHVIGNPMLNGATLRADAALRLPP